MVVTDGDAARAFLDSIGFRCRARRGPARVILAVDATIELLHTPDIDECLDSSASKQQFWAAFNSAPGNDEPPPTER